MFYELHQGGNDDLIWIIVIGMVIGAICSIPAIIIASRKQLPTTTMFWFSVFCGGIGGVYLGIPAGIINIIYAIARRDPRKPVDPDRIRWGRILVPCAALAICLVILPNVLTHWETYPLPDNRTWFEKMRGDSPPSATVEVANWGTISILTLIACIGAHFGARAAEVDEPNQAGNGGTLP